MARAIPRRKRVVWWLGLVLAVAFAALLVPAITAERWLGVKLEPGVAAPITVRVETSGGASYIVARGDTPTSADVALMQRLDDDSPRGPTTYVAYFALVLALAAVFAHHMRRSRYGRLVRVQLVSLVLIAILCIVVKVVLLVTAVSILVVPVAVLALVPVIALDRVVGLATGILAALVVALLAPFDLGIATVLLVQVSVAGLLVAERPKQRIRALVVAGAASTLFTALIYPLLRYLSTGHFPTGELDSPWHSAWVAAALGPAIATGLAIVFVPAYQLLVGEITRGKLYQLEDLSHPLLRQIAEKSPGTWQHSLAMANMAQLAADKIGADGRLVRVGAYFHDLGKSLSPKYFIENLEPGETSPHDQLAPEVSCDAIFAHVTEGLATARRAGLHERIVDFMHMHHGNGVLEYFWSKCKEQGNPRKLTIEDFRYPGHPPQSRETAILAICDAVEAASRTLKKTDAATIDSLVQRIVYGKLHLGQLDESGMSMSDLRMIADSLRETIKHANHGRIEYPWQKEERAAEAKAAQDQSSGRLIVTTGPRLDSLDRPASSSSDIVTPVARPKTVSPPSSLRVTGDDDTADMRKIEPEEIVPGARISREELAISATAPAFGSRPNPAPRASIPPPDAGLPAVRSSADDIEVVTQPRRLEDKPPSMNATLAGPDLQPSRTRTSNPDIATAPTPRPAEVAMATAPTPRTKSADIAPPTISPRTKTGSIPAQTVVGRAASRPDIAAPAVSRTPTGPNPSITTTVPATPRTRTGSMPVTPPPPPQPRTKTGSMPAVNVEADPNKPTTITGVPPMRQSAPAIGQPKLFPDPGTTSAPKLFPEPNPNQPTTLPGSPAPISSSPGLRPPGTPLPSTALGLGVEPIRKLPAVILEDENRVTARDLLAAVSQPNEDDLGATNPRLKMPLPAPPVSRPKIELPEKPWATGLAARIDAAIDDQDGWGHETPVMAPTPAELRALLGVPDTTRKQSIDELERLHKVVHSERSEDSDPEILLEPPQPRRPPPTTEVTDDDIQSAIEIAPPARRQTSIGVSKKKSE